MLPHAPPTFFTWSATAVVWQSVQTDFTPIPPPGRAHSAIQVAVCAQVLVPQPAHLARSTAQPLQRTLKLTSRRSVRQCAHWSATEVSTRTRLTECASSATLHVVSVWTRVRTALPVRT
jgi:hypothetical protein